jgi:hypothetical protein
MKKRIKYFTSLFIFLLPFPVLTSCKEKPWYAENVVWSSEQPEIEIIKDAGKDNYGYMFVGDKKILITLSWGPGLSFSILETNEDGTIDTISDELALVKGKLKYNSKKVTLTIMEDNVFNFEFKKIILTKRDL